MQYILEADLFIFILFCYYYYFCLFVLFTPTAYGSSQARGLIGAVANTTSTATPDPSCIYKLRHSSWQHRILNPLGEDQTRNVMVPHRIRFCWATRETPRLIYFTYSSLYLLIPYCYFAPPAFPLPTGNHLFFLCIYVSISVSVLLHWLVCFTL